MSINRVHRKKSNFSQILNEGAHSVTIGWAAKGILWYLLTKPDGWEVRTSHLVSTFPDGERIVKAGLKDLEENGYLIRWCDRGNRGRLEWKSEIFESLEDANLWKEENADLIQSAIRYSKGTSVAMGITGDSPSVQKPTMVAPSHGQPCDGQPCDGKRPVLIKTERLNTDLSNTELVNTDLQEEREEALPRSRNAATQESKNESRDNEVQQMEFAALSKQENIDRSEREKSGSDKPTPRGKKTQKEKIEINFERFQQAWNDMRLPSFSKMQIVSDRRKKAIRNFVENSCSNSEDLAIGFVQDALSQARVSDWLQGRDYGFDWLFRKNRSEELIIVELAEKWTSRQQQASAIERANVNASTPIAVEAEIIEEAESVAIAPVTQSIAHRSNKVAAFDARFTQKSEAFLRWQQLFKAEFDQLGLNDRLPGDFDAAWRKWNEKGLEDVNLLGICEGTALYFEGQRRQMQTKGECFPLGAVNFLARGAWMAALEQRQIQQQFPSQKKITLKNSTKEEYLAALQEEAVKRGYAAV